MIDFSSSMTTMELARLLERNHEHPEEYLFGKLLVELGNQSAERIRSSAFKMELKNLKTLTAILNEPIEAHKQECVLDLAKTLTKDGYTAEDIVGLFEGVAK